MLRFSDIPVMCLRVSDDIDAVIWVKNAWTISTLFLTFNRLIRDSSSAQFIIWLKNVSIRRAVFSYAPLSSLLQTVMEETSPFILSAY